ncbi:hypothetical protein ElyMa_001809600 [Elysia marginata]|uniref:DNA helicase n=1 Tax=Elysia marginata TaxID=1093978 RepID=A0AAV4EI32_9GAST|nr:hypothetical protein ElyMa_001809600 [Elysia marginata]
MSWLLPRLCEMKFVNWDLILRLPNEELVKGMMELLDFAFGDLSASYTKPHWLSSRAIICPTNAVVDEANRHIMMKFPGQEIEYRSSDTVIKNDHQYPVEFISKLCPSGFICSRLAIVMRRRYRPRTGGSCQASGWGVD